MMLARVRVSDIVSSDGMPGDQYLRAVAALSDSLAKHNAAIIELEREDAAVMRCGLEATRSHFRSRASLENCQEVCTYRAGMGLDDLDSSPPCMAEIYRIMGKAARATLSAIAKHLRLRSDVFNHLLDDAPLPANTISSSFLVAAFSHLERETMEGRMANNSETEKGLLAFISTDLPFIEVRDPNGRWVLADCNSATGDLLLIPGTALCHVTGGLRPASSYRINLEFLSDDDIVERSSLMFKLMPQKNAILDCSSITAAGHVIPQSYVPVAVSQFMKDHIPSDEIACTQSNEIHVDQGNLIKGQSLRSALSDPISGAFLEDAVVVSCGHSFGGLMLERVLGMGRCSTCNAQVDRASLIPNIALRSAAAIAKHEDERRLFHNAANRKRRRESGDHADGGKSTIRGYDETTDTYVSNRRVEYPFSIQEKVLIVGNKRTPEKLFGREAIITSQSLNGWYLVKVIGTDETVRLQYRSLRKVMNPQPIQVLSPDPHQHETNLPEI